MLNFVLEISDPGTPRRAVSAVGRGGCLLTVEREVEGGPGRAAGKESRAGLRA